MNNWLRFAVEAHPTPTVSGHRIRLKYMTQVKSRPPSFVIFCTKGDDVPDSYKRYLINTLKKDFDLFATPIRLTFRTQKNPYKK
jgi:GTP-binding protein